MFMSLIAFPKSSSPVENKIKLESIYKVKRCAQGKTGFVHTVQSLQLHK